jgi:hypothetical protein
MGTKTKQGRRIALVLAILLAINGLAPALVSAGGLTSTYLRLNRMAQGTDSSLRLVFTTSSATASEDNVKLDFGSAWNTASGTIAASPVVSSASCAAETGATAMPGTLVGTGASNTTLTISGVTNLTASTAYCVDITTGTSVHNPSTPGTYFVTVTTQTSTTVDDTAKIALAIVGNDSITVTATVPPTFSFALDSNSTAFTANLSPGTKQVTTPRTVTVNTNAKTGWVAWLRNQDTNGLFSSSVNANIAPTTPGTAVNVDTTPSVEQYVWGVTAATQVAGVGTTSLNTAYDATGGTNEGSGVDNSYRQIASSNGTSQDAVLTLAAAATISPITPAASDYTDVIQVIGAGNF